MFEYNHPRVLLIFLSDFYHVQIMHLSYQILSVFQIIIFYIKFFSNHREHLKEFFQVIPFSYMSKCGFQLFLQLLTSLFIANYVICNNNNSCFSGNSRESCNTTEPIISFQFIPVPVSSSPITHPAVA